MGKLSNFFKTKKVVKIIGIIIVVIVIIVAIWLWSIFGPSFKIVNILGKINGKSYNLEKNDAYVAYNGRCKVNVYPSENLYEPDLIQDTKSNRTLFLYVKSDDDAAISISVLPTKGVSSDVINNMNTIANLNEPKISREYNTLNYFVYNGRNYFYNLNQAGIMFTTPINDNYLYWVMIMYYNNLTKEDIESILYFDVI